MKIQVACQAIQVLLRQPSPPPNHWFRKEALPPVRSRTSSFTSLNTQYKRKRLSKRKQCLKQTWVPTATISRIVEVLRMPAKMLCLGKARYLGQVAEVTAEITVVLRVPGKHGHSHRGQGRKGPGSQLL